MKKLVLDLNSLKPGDRFRDSEGDLCIYLGYAKEHELQSYYGSAALDIDNKQTAVQLVKHRYAPARTYALFYKNTWSVEKFKYGQTYYQDVPTDESATAVNSMGAQFVSKFECRIAWDD